MVQLDKDYRRVLTYTRQRADKRKCFRSHLACATNIVDEQGSLSISALSRCSEALRDNKQSGTRSGIH